MKNRTLLSPSTLGAIAALSLTAGALAGGIASRPGTNLTGHYLEVRSCDVYTGPCFANAEMGQDGKEALLVWTIGEGAWNDTQLDGLSVIAVVRTRDTLGDLKYANPRGDTVLILDQRANEAQRAALSSFARARAGKLIGEVVATVSTDIHTNIGSCTKAGTCATVTAGDVVHVATRCLCDEDHVCGNEYRYYPPLTEVDSPVAAFTESFAYQGDELRLKWATTGLRSAYVGSFTL